MRPYAECQTDFGVVQMIYQGGSPFRLQNCTELPKVLTLSWEYAPSKRPSVGEFVSLKQGRGSCLIHGTPPAEH